MNRYTAHPWNPSVNKAGMDGVLFYFPIPVMI